MKKVLALVLVAMMALSMVAVANAEGVKTYKVGVSIYQFTDNFMTLYRNEIENYFKSLETDSVKYEITMADGKNDMAEQTNQVQNFITQGMDVIILNLVQTSSADAVIDQIVGAGIPQVGQIRGESADARKPHHLVRRDLREHAVMRDTEDVAAGVLHVAVDVDRGACGEQDRTSENELFGWNGRLAGERLEFGAFEFDPRLHRGCTESAEFARGEGIAAGQGKSRADGEARV